GRPAAGKTGTTNDTRDAWFIGFTPDLLAGVWVGYDSERSLGSWATGGHAAAPIWASFMRKALDGTPVIQFPVPSGVHVASASRADSVQDDVDSKPRTRHLRRIARRAARADRQEGRTDQEISPDELDAPRGRHGGDQSGFRGRTPPAAWAPAGPPALQPPVGRLRRPDSPAPPLP